MADKKKMLVAVFRDRVNAQTAYDRLINRGYTNSEINVLMSDTTRAKYQAERHEGKHDAGTHVAEGAATGGVVGTAVGATIAALMAAGSAIMIPGVGWIAGPVIAALAGAGAGALTGGLVGAMIGLGISESNARAYEGALREGGVVIGVLPRSSDDADAIKKEFENLNGENICFA
jgi:hypothetical protein